MVNNNMQDGIAAGGDSLVSGNTSISNFQFGISASGGLVERNLATINTFVGLSLSGTAAYRANVVNSNAGGNANPQVSGGIEIGTNMCGGDTTCP